MFTFESRRPIDENTREAALVQLVHPKAHRLIRDILDCTEIAGGMPNTVNNKPLTFKDRQSVHMYIPNQIEVVRPLVRGNGVQTSHDTTYPQNGAPHIPNEQPQVYIDVASDVIDLTLDEEIEGGHHVREPLVIDITQDDEGNEGGHVREPPVVGNNLFAGMDFIAVNQADPTTEELAFRDPGTAPAGRFIPRRRRRTMANRYQGRLINHTYHSVLLDDA